MRTSAAILALVALAGTASGAGPVTLVSGDQVASKITEYEDADGFLLMGTAGGSFSVSVTATEPGFGPQLRLFDPAGEEVSLSPWIELAPGGASLASVPFAMNGLHLLEVTGGGSTKGAFSLRYKAKNSKGVKAKGETLAPAQSRTYGFAAAGGGTVKVSVKYRTPDAPPTLVDLLDPDEGSHAGALTAGPKGLSGSLVATGAFGEWRLVLRNDGAADAVFDVSILSKLPKAKKSSRTFPNVSITSVADIHGTKAPLTFDVWDPERRAVTVRFSYSLDDGATWTDCQPTPGGPNPLTVGGGATGYQFEWATLAQVTEPFGRTCEYLPAVRIRAEVDAPDGDGDGDEFHPSIPPLELWTYPEPSRVDLRADLYADLGADGVLGSFALIDARAEADYETRHLPGATFDGPPHSFALGDFDEDLVPDLVTAEPGGTSVLLFPGIGDGTFGAPVRAGPGQRPERLAVADLDGDDHLDVIHSNRESFTVTVLLGNGDGSFAPPIAFDAGRFVRDLAVADLDGDPDPDLLLLSGARSLPTVLPGHVAVLLGQGDGTFGSLSTFACGSDPTSLAPGRFDGDLLLDLAVTNRRTYGPPTVPDVSVLLGNGDGTFDARVPYEVGDDPTSVAIADFDLDGAADLAVANRASGNVSVLRGGGDGTFAAAATVFAGNQPQHLVAADLTGDLRPDLAVTNRRYVAPGTSTPPAVAVVRSLPAGGFSAPVLLAAGEDPARVLVGDLDGDLLPDVVAGNAAPDNRSVFLGSGGGDFSALSPDKDRRTIFYCHGIG